MANTAEQTASSRRGGKSPEAFRTITEVAKELDLPQHVLRFWETKFTQIKPLKRGGGRRYYRPEDVALLIRIRALLYDDGYTIKGVQKLLRDTNGKIDTPVNGNAAPASDSASVDTVLDKRKNNDLKAIVGELEELRDLLRKS